MLRRLLVSILGFLALWLGTALPAVGAADLPTHPELVHAYAYDGDSATAPYGTAIERGPPTIVSAGRHAVGSPSCGVSACPAGSTSPSAYGFDHPYKVARVTFDAGMIRGSVEDTRWDSVDVDHGGVAAKGATAGKTAVIGRQWDTAVAKDWPGHEVLDLPKWSIARNDAWVNGVIERGQKVYIGSPETKANLWDSVNNRSTVFGRELSQFHSAGYVRSGDYLLPPG